MSADNSIYNNINLETLPILKNLTDKTILVTGVAGFIASHLTDALLAAGAKVIGVDNLVTGKEANLVEALKNPNFTFIKADVIADPATYLPAGFAGTQESSSAGGELNFQPSSQNKSLDGVLHFASPASPPRYQAHPKLTYRVNSVATDLLLSYLQKYYPQARLLFASTSESYGDPVVHPQPETYWGNVNPNGPRSCYDESKRLGETICGVHARDFKMDVRIIRIFNTYGNRMDPKDGRVIPNFVTQILNDQPITIYGDGSQTRSYCFVDDLVRGILTFFALDKGVNGQELAGETINLGNPQEYTVLETAKTIYQLIKAEQNLSETEIAAEFDKMITFKDLPKDDPTRRQPDISKAKEFLDWQPSIDFEAGLKPTIEYFK